MSKNYTHFIGIDIGKKEVVAAKFGSKTTFSFKNSPAGIKKFFTTYSRELNSTLVVLETTGGYEALFLEALLERRVDVHRANTRQVKNFIRSWGKQGKSDALDAQALALYGFERHVYLPLFQKLSPAHQQLASLAYRRQDLTHMIVQEKNRLKAPARDSMIQESCQHVIHMLEEQISRLDQHMVDLIQSHPLLDQQKALLVTIPGIGPIVATQLLAFMPELGQRNRREIASLAGLAPYPCESGQKIGLRRTKGGRQQARAVLFIAAMAARNSHSPFKTFYEKLISEGKKKMVALTALMRKILVVANAKMKQNYLQNIVQTSTTT